MTKDVVTVRTFAPFRAIATAMLSRGIGAVPVVDDRNVVVGIVSRGDLLSACLRDVVDVADEKQPGKDGSVSAGPATADPATATPGTADPYYPGPLF